MRFARFNLVTASVAAGASFDSALYYQAGAGAAGQIGVQVFLDSDFNPYNGNEIMVADQTLPKTGTLVVSLATVTGTPNAALVAPGSYAVSARVSDGALARDLYAPELLTVTPSQQPPSIDSMMRTGGVMHFTVHGLPGQQVTVEASIDLASWTPLQTHVFTGTVWEFADADAGSFASRFYRARLNL